MVGLAAAADIRAEGQSTAAAEALFREGRTLMEGGRVSEACEKFRESQRLEASSGTAINLAACYEAQGKTASAWAAYLVAARIAQSQQKTERAEEATRKASDLEKQLSYLTVVAAEKVPGLTVRVGGVLLEQSSIGAKLPTDPGEHVVEASAPGYKSATASVTLGAGGDAQTFTLPKLEKLPEKAEVPKPDLSEQSRRSHGAETTTTGGDTERARSTTVPWIIGGAGAALTGIGAAFGVLALSSNSEAKSLCGGRTTDCPQGAISRQDTAYSQANVANVLVGVGLAGIATATIWLVVASPQPEKSTASTRVRVDGTLDKSSLGVTVRGRF